MFVIEGKGFPVQWIEFRFSGSEIKLGRERKIVTSNKQS
jgi:hypothetical protein